MDLYSRGQPPTLRLDLDELGPPNAGGWESLGLVLEDEANRYGFSLENPTGRFGPWHVLLRGTHLLEFAKRNASGRVSEFIEFLRCTDIRVVADGTQTTIPRAPYIPFKIGVLSALHEVV